MKEFENEVGASQWRLKKQKYNFVGNICLQCSQKEFPPKETCTNCGNHEYENYTFSGRGEIYSFTTLFNLPTGYKKYAPLVLALIKLEEGKIITAKLTDIDPNEPINIGDPVEMVVREISPGSEGGIIKYGYAFRPPIEKNINSS